MPLGPRFNGLEVVEHSSCKPICQRVLMPQVTIEVIGYSPYRTLYFKCRSGKYYFMAMLFDTHPNDIVKNILVNLRCLFRLFFQNTDQVFLKPVNLVNLKIMVAVFFVSQKMRL